MAILFADNFTYPANVANLSGNLGANFRALVEAGYETPTEILVSGANSFRSASVNAVGRQGNGARIGWYQSANTGTTAMNFKNPVGLKKTFGFTWEKFVSMHTMFQINSTYAHAALGIRIPLLRFGPVSISVERSNLVGTDVTVYKVFVNGNPVEFEITANAWLHFEVEINREAKTYRVYSSNTRVFEQRNAQDFYVDSLEFIGANFKVSDSALPGDPNSSHVGSIFVDHIVVNDASGTQNNKRLRKLDFINIVPTSTGICEFAPGTNSKASVSIAGALGNPTEISGTDFISTNEDGRKVIFGSKQLPGKRPLQVSANFVVGNKEPNGFTARPIIKFKHIEQTLPTMVFRNGSYMKTSILLNTDLEGNQWTEENLPMLKWGIESTKRLEGLDVIVNGDENMYVFTPNLDDDSYILSEEDDKGYKRMEYVQPDKFEGDFSYEDIPFNPSVYFQMVYANGMFMNYTYRAPLEIYGQYRENNGKLRLFSNTRWLENPIKLAVGVNFAIEFKVNFSKAEGIVSLLRQFQTSDNETYFAIEYDFDLKRFNITLAGAVVNVAFDLEFDKDYAFELSRTATVARLFVNGKLVHSRTYNTATASGFSRLTNKLVGHQVFEYDLWDFRITFGENAAAHTEEFEPSFEPLPLPGRNYLNAEQVLTATNLISFAYNKFHNFGNGGQVAPYLERTPTLRFGELCQTMDYVPPYMALEGKQTAHAVYPKDMLSGLTRDEYTVAVRLITVTDSLFWSIASNPTAQYADITMGWHENAPYLYSGTELSYKSASPGSGANYSLMDLIFVKKRNMIATYVASVTYGDQKPKRMSYPYLGSGTNIDSFIQGLRKVVDKEDDLTAVISMHPTISRQGHTWSSYALVKSVQTFDHAICDPWLDTEIDYTPMADVPPIEKLHLPLTEYGDYSEVAVKSLIAQYVVRNSKFVAQHIADGVAEEIEVEGGLLGFDSGYVIPIVSKKHTIDIGIQVDSDGLLLRTENNLEGVPVFTVSRIGGKLVVKHNADELVSDFDIEGSAKLSLVSFGNKTFVFWNGVKIGKVNRVYHIDTIVVGTSEAEGGIRYLRAFDQVYIPTDGNDDIPDAPVKRNSLVQSKRSGLIAPLFGYGLNPDGTHDQYEVISDYDYQTDYGYKIFVPFDGTTARDFWYPYGGKASTSYVNVKCAEPKTIRTAMVFLNRFANSDATTYIPRDLEVQAKVDGEWQTILDATLDFDIYTTRYIKSLSIPVQTTVEATEFRVRIWRRTSAGANVLTSNVVLSEYDEIDDNVYALNLKIGDAICPHATLVGTDVDEDGYVSFVDGKYATVPETFYDIFAVGLRDFRFKAKVKFNSLSTNQIFMYWGDVRVTGKARSFEFFYDVHNRALVINTDYRNAIPQDIVYVPFEMEPDIDYDIQLVRVETKLLLYVNGDFVTSVPFSLDLDRNAGREVTFGSYTLSATERVYSDMEVKDISLQVQHNS